ncbi:hypothetical protein NQ318_015120 [Aromia moschata]|uniref:Peroxisome assembly protein 12 n=1 Tax=Aromia moschata TaxID=1265417 RepID=A0AAV8YXV4_9CUCU|nr:hypothetical protein NQ318_015120 [Aromia moschata]
MAENAANFTFTYQNKPSIFEIVAQKTLNDTLHPALQKIALFLANNFPHKFNWLNKYYEETFLVLNGLLQYHYLNHYDSSFSENFYGLKRTLVNNEGLTKHHRELSLIFLVVLPYFKRKMEEKAASLELRIRRVFKKGPTEKIDTPVAFHFRGRVGPRHPAHLSQVHGQQGRIPDAYFKTDRSQTGLRLRADRHSRILDCPLHGLSELSFGLVKNAVTTFLEVTAFFLQFLNTWNAQRSNFSITDLPAVAPPQLDGKAKIYQGKCPVCLKPWVIPTVLPVSGYIFCFRCILRYLSENQRCPVTNLPAKPLDIVRLYIN